VSSRRGRWRRWASRLAGLALLASTVPAASLILVQGMPNPVHAQETALEIHSAHGSSFVPALSGKRPLFILVLGSDARPGQNAERARADSIHIVGIDVKKKRASILGFPRDSWVSIPGYGMAKINTALFVGGPKLVVQTIENITGIRIDFYILTSFWGLEGLVNGIGGLEVDVPYGMHDRFSGSNFSAGKQKLSGKEALSFSRDRHSVPNGDFSRSMNQGRLLVAALKKLRSGFEKDPGLLFTWIGVGWRHVRTDLSLQTLLDLGLTATQISSGKVDNRVVPASVGTVGAQSVVFISSSASSLYRDMRADGVIGK
jgi:polyisoprenyl-teichoic acid--peptidoglycan teichoic acid transferase